ncbi:Signal transduction histidine kinase [Maribacter ulvicola]|uniref:histidine kinase n=2 Tax=Maribacter ulvicola TaxID=228959 RepID=A0A1N6WNZ1_9FLAO|nr:Signal transduction histidine kinase [Maribacter ulvicola]
MVENGLSHNTVMSSLQDKKGFLWFGTKNGLNRFDGYNFRLFQRDEEQPNTLNSNYILSLHEYEGKLWVGTASGLYIYNEQNENFHFIEGTKNSQIWEITGDSKGNLWFLANGTLVRYNLSEEKCHWFLPKDYFYATDVLTIGDDIWTSSNSHLYHYNYETDDFEAFKHTTNSTNEKPFTVNEIFSIDPATILIGTSNHGIVSFDINTKKSKNVDFFGSEKPHVRDFTLRENELWVASESGIHIYDLLTKEYINLTKDYDDPYALSDNAVYTLTVDNEGGVWAGTYFGGINYQPKQYTPFKKYFPKSSQNSLNGNAIREICEDKYGNLWIGTEDGGLNKLNPTTNIFTNFTSQEKDKKGILSHYNIHALYPNEDKLYIGMFENGIDVLDIKTNNIIEHYGRDDGISSDFVYAIYKGRNDELYYISTVGIKTFDSVSKKFIPFDIFPSNQGYYCLLEDDEGVFWTGGYFSGIMSFNPETNKKTVYSYSPENSQSISNNHINYLFQDSKKNIWICTEDGLNLFDSKNNTFLRFGTQNGFPSNVFYTILEDDSGNLWISTSKGLVNFNPITGKKKIYTKADGLSSDNFNYMSAHKSKNGTMYFGSVNGMISFNPKEFTQNTYRAPIYITSLQINNKDVFVGQQDATLTESISSLKSLKLTPEQASFSLEFAALSYTAPENTEYWYKMKGLNDKWVYLKKDHKVFFTELAPGTYEFIVKSKNSSGVWGKETHPLAIEVLPVFWKSKMAYILYLLIIGFIIFAGFITYARKIKANNAEKIKQLNNRKEKEIYQAKIEFFTNVSHEIRTPLTLIQSPLEKVIKKLNQLPDVKDNLTIIKKNTNHLLDLVNQLLDFRKTEIERVDLTFVETNISDLIDNMHERFGEAIQDKQVNFKFRSEHKQVIACVDPEAFKKIIGNLFGNAFKYADKMVDVNLIANETDVTIILRNDGPLIPSQLKERIFEPFYRATGTEGQTGSGIGLALARSLTEMHNGCLNLNTNDNKMNCFVLVLPIHQEREFRLRPKYTHKRQPNNNNTTLVSNSNCILLVEDSIDLLEFVAKELREKYIVLKASNGEAALDLLKENNIQLVISDVMMPGINGFTLCKKIKTNLETSHIPVILLTSKSAMSAKMKGLESGADAYIEKPFSIKHLNVHITNIIENRKNILEHYASSPLAHIKSIANTKTDETFIKKLDEVIYQNMSDSDLNVETLAKIMNMSRSTLYRKIKDISNLSPNELINIARLKKSAELLKSGKYRIFEVAEIVGYNSATSFGRNFQKQFEMTPSEYMNNEY